MQEEDLIAIILLKNKAVKDQEYEIARFLRAAEKELKLKLDRGK